MLHLESLAPRTPRLPRHRWGAPRPLAASIALHLAVVVLAVLLGATTLPRTDVRRAQSVTDQQEPDSTCISCFSRHNCHGRVAAGVAEGISDRSPSVARRASARMRSRYGCEAGRRQRSQERQSPYLSTTFPRSHRSWSMPRRWLPVFSTRLERRLPV